MCHLESFLSFSVVWKVRQSLSPAKWAARVGVSRSLCPRGDAVPDGDRPTPIVSRQRGGVTLDGVMKDVGSCSNGREKGRRGERGRREERGREVERREGEGKEEERRKEGEKEEERDRGSEGRGRGSWRECDGLHW